MPVKKERKSTSVLDYASFSHLLALKKRGIITKTVFCNIDEIANRELRKTKLKSVLGEQ